MERPWGVHLPKKIIDKILPYMTEVIDTSGLSPEAAECAKSVVLAAIKELGPTFERRPPGSKDSDFADTERKRDLFLKRIIKLPNGCWDLYRHTQSKYQREYRAFNGMPAHRYSYRMFKGEIPKGYHIDHLCMEPNCVNPDHLEAVTPGENIRRGMVARIVARSTRQEDAAEAAKEMMRNG